MASTEELEAQILAEMEENPEAYLVEPVNDILMIDPETRTISVPSSETLFGARQDMDAERKYFKCPKIVGDNIDLSKCHIYVSYVPSKQDGTYDINEDVGSCLCEDVAVDGDYITFSWKLSGNVFVKAGSIAFSVYAKQADTDGTLKTKWHTTFAIGKILDTLPDGEQIAEKYADVIEQLLNKMENVEQIATPEAMQGYVNKYLDENPPSGMTADEKVQLNKNTEDISSLSEDIANLKPGGASWTTTQIDNLESVLYMMEFSTEEKAAEGKIKIDTLITSLRSGASSGGSNEGGDTEVTLTSISAVYNGGEVPEGTSASDLDITVTANYSDGSSAVVTGWSISGTVYEGENSFVISYGGKTTIVKVTGVKQSVSSGYITDGLIFNLDAIDSDITDSSWTDATGNYAAKMNNSAVWIVDAGTYVYPATRCQVKVDDTALLADMGTDFSVEAVWQNRYLDSNGVATDATISDTTYIFNVGNGNNNMLIANNGKCRILGNTTVYGDGFTSNDDILHCTITYDGTTYSLYHDGVLVTSMNASMDLSSQTKAEFWGNMDWATITYGSFNAGRIYNRCLTADEVKANYDVDIERFGTQNIAAA